jgi:uncharacterized membrane protein
MSTTPPDGPDYGQTPPSGGTYGGYGDVPPPPNFDKPVPTPSDWSVGDALAYGWKKFQENVGQILLAALILLVASIIAGVISAVLREVLTSSPGYRTTSRGLEYHSGSGTLTSLFVSGLSEFVFSLVTLVISAAILRGALDITEGRPFQVTGLFSRLNFGNVILAGLLVSVITAVGIVLCVLPGIVAWFMLLFTPIFVVDKNLGPVDAVKAAFQFTRDNLSNMLIWVIVGGIVYLLGFCLCGVGALVSVPVVLIGAAYTYKKLTGQPVAP